MPPSWFFVALAIVVLGIVFGIASVKFEEWRDRRRVD